MSIIASNSAVCDILPEKSERRDHLSNRPAGYIEARCVKCGAALFVAADTPCPRCEKCPEGLHGISLADRITQATLPQSAEETRGLNYIRARLGNPSFVEFMQIRKFVHFSNGTSASNQYSEEWGCNLQVKYGGTMHFVSGAPSACAAAARAVAKYLEEQARLTEEAEREMYDAENEPERFEQL